MDVTKILLLMRQACPVGCEVSVSLSSTDEWFLQWRFKDANGTRCGRTISYTLADFRDPRQIENDIQASEEYIKENIKNGLGSQKP